MVFGLTWPLGWLPALYARNFPCPILFKIASAMIDRAEFPVWRNRRLNACSVMGLNGFGFSPALRGFRLTKLRAALAALIGQVRHQRVHRVEFCRIDHRAAVAADIHKPGCAQAVEMKRQSVRGQSKARGDVARGHSFRARLHQQAENVEAIVLRQCRQNADGALLFHTSMNIEIKCPSSDISIMTEISTSLGPNAVLARPKRRRARWPLRAIRQFSLMSPKALSAIKKQGAEHMHAHLGNSRFIGLAAIAGIAATLACTAPGPAAAEDYPSRTISLVVA